MDLPFFLLHHRQADRRGRGSWVLLLRELGLLGNNAMEGRKEEAHFYQVIISSKWAFAPSTEILPGNAQRRRRNKAPFLPIEIFVFLFRVCKQRDQGLFCNRFLSVPQSP
ncbi:hypothetical protein CY35_19G030500 [Sphagnum magellanicum]|nr:hypothetical protein CY35_19G030500 [Sphagnum magellanicum]